MVKVDLTGAAGFLGDGPDYDAAGKAFETLISRSGPGADFFAHPLHPYSRAMLEALPENGLQANMGFAPPRTNIDAQSACHFLDRCPCKSEKCLRTPPLFALENGRKVRCWNYADSAR